MTATILLAVLAVILIPAYAPQLLKPRSGSGRRARLLAGIAAVVADINNASQRMFELQTTWPANRATPAKRRTATSSSSH